MIAQVLFSETGMPVSSLLKLFEEGVKLYVTVPRKSLSTEKATAE